MWGGKGEGAVTDPRFLQEGFEHCLHHAVEECGEFISAAMKLDRWGPFSVDPTIPEAQQETNLAWMRREMDDVRQTLDRLEAAIEEEYD